MRGVGEEKRASGLLFYICMLFYLVIISVLRFSLVGGLVLFRPLGHSSVSMFGHSVIRSFGFFC